MPGKRRHVPDPVEQPVEEAPHRLLRLQHRVEVAHRVAPICAAPEGQVRRSIRRKLGAVGEDQLREGRHEGPGLLDGAEVPGGDIRERRDGAVIGIVPAADLGVEPVAGVPQQVLEAALGHQDPDAHRKRPVIDLLLGRAAPVDRLLESTDVRILFPHAL